MSTSHGRFLRDTRDAVVALRLLVLVGISMLGLSHAPKYPSPFWALVITYGATNIVYMASGAARFLSTRIRGAVFVVDVIVVSLLVVLRGTNVPEFILAYFTLVLMAAIVQGIGTALLNAVVVCTVFAAVSLWGQEGRRILEFQTLAQFAFFFVVSVFMSQVAEWGREQARERARVDAERRRLTVEIEDRTRDLSKSVEELDTARRRLAAADRLATIGMLAAGVAHDIRNPVTALQAALEDARTLLAEPPQSWEADADADGPGRLLISAVEDACAACEQLNRVAGDLTNVARVTPAVPVAVSSRSALEGAARLLRHRAKHPLSIVVACSTEEAVLADPGRLQQVLLNLGANALDAMEGTGGVLTFGAESSSPSIVRFRVADTGVGMDEDTTAKVLRGFYTTKESGKGTGLGLHLVREIVEAHGAHLELETEPGRGTTFVIDWPAAPRPQSLGDTRNGTDLEPDAADRGRRGGNPPCASAHAPA